MIRTSLFVAAAILGVATVHATDTDNYKKSIEQWRAGRVERLTAPTGWLSLIGLEWLKDGANRIGSAVYNPAQLKTIQEVITLVIFAAFSTLYLKEAFTWSQGIGFAFIALGAFFVFHKF